MPCTTEVSVPQLKNVIKLPVYLLDDTYHFPPAEGAENGIVAIGGDLSLERLLSAYKNGIFPWYSEGEPIIWWSPDPRFVLLPDELHISKSMHRVVNSKEFTITLDADFPFVIRQCAEVSRNDENGTWITEEMIAAYCVLHESGYAHSVEVWKNNTMVGGIYGISLGKVFFAESMFHTETNASKLAFIRLTQLLKQNEYMLLDAQVYTKHVESLGAKEISRKEFMQLLQKGLQYESSTGKWKFEANG
jgi:leucyl/phenylalanyl-tRNA--protein transferase